MPKSSTAPIRVAFVDDDPSVLQGLGNVLRRYRREWDMAFFSDSAEALDRLVADPVDVVVSDARMPRVSGEVLLRELQQRAPGTARVVLSGQSEVAQATRLLGVAHQYLSKPCEPAHLAEVVHRVASVRRELHAEALQAVVGAASQLPPAPRVWTELTAVLNKDTADAKRVAKVVESDPVLVAKVLQMANSAYFGLAQEVSSLARAVMVLGFEPLRSMVLAFEIERAFVAPDVDLDGMRRRSLFAAQLARTLLPAGALADAAFTAALLSDLGALLLATRAPRVFLPLWGAGASPESEAEALGVTHALAGARVLSLWGLPAAIVDLVALHHMPPVEQAPASLAPAVWLSIALAEALAPAPDAPLPQTVESYVARHSLHDAVARAREFATKGALH